MLVLPLCIGVASSCFAIASCIGVVVSHIGVILKYLLLNMEESFENENTYDVFMNEVSVEDEPLQKLEKNASVQIEGSRNSKNNEEKMKENLKKIHAQKKYFGNQIVELHCVGCFIVLMITKKLT